MQDPLKYNARVTFRCDDKLVEALTKVAKRTYSRPSDIVRRGVVAQLRREGWEFDDE